MKLVLIVAMAKDRSIGHNNSLLWHIPEDLKRFKALTTGHAIVMGRRTWESLPKGALPNRRNVVISRTITSLLGAEVYPSIDDALSALGSGEFVYIIGGGDVYQQTISLAEEMHVTLVQAEYPDADTHFPEFDWSDWDILEQYNMAEYNYMPVTYFHLVKKK